jgi:hypothetical protein
MTWLQVCISALAVIGLMIVFCVVAGYLMYRAEYLDEHADKDNWRGQ